MAADVQVAKLMEMGFNREDVVKALSSNSLNFESALGERTVTASPLHGGSGRDKILKSLTHKVYTEYLTWEL